MKDKKRKYDLSYFMMHGGSDSVGYMPPPAASNLNDELEKLQRNIKEERERQQAENERKEAERLENEKSREDEDEAAFKQMLTESGFTSNGIGKQILQQATESIKMAKPTGANFSGKMPKNNRTSFESTSNTQKGIALAEKQAEKRAAIQKEREAEYAKLKNEDIRKQLEVISVIQLENGLTDNNLAIFIELYCGDKKKYNDLFNNFFEAKFKKFFREIDELKKRNKISEKFTRQLVEVLTYKEENKERCSKFLKEDIKRFLEIFNKGTDFSNATNNMFEEYKRELASFLDLTELNTKEIYEIFKILYVIRGWITVTFGQGIDIGIEVLPENILQQRLNIFCKYLEKPEIKIEDIESLEAFESFIGTNLRKVMSLVHTDKLVGLIRRGLIDEFIDKIKKYKDSEIITEEQFKRIISILQDDSKNLETQKIPEIEKIIKIITQWFEETMGYLNEYYKSAEIKEKESREKRLRESQEEEAAKRKLENNKINLLKKKREEEEAAAEFRKLQAQSGGVVNSNGFTRIPTRAELRIEKQKRKSIKKQERKSSSKAKQSGPVKPLTWANRFKKSLLKPTETKPTENKPTETKSTESIKKKSRLFDKTIPFRNIVKGTIPKAALVQAQNAALVQAQNAAPVQAQNAALVQAQNAAPVQAQNAAPVKTQSNEWQYQNSHRKFLRKQKAIKRAIKRRKNEEKIKEINNKRKEINALHKASEKTKKREERLKIENEKKRQEKEKKRKEEMNELKNITLKLFRRKKSSAIAADAKNSKKEDFVIMISPHKTFGELTVFIDKKEINVQKILEISDKITLLINQLFELQDLQNKIKQLKISLFDTLIESGYNQEHKISDLVLNILDINGISELFINYYLNQYNEEDIIGRILRILKNHICEIDIKVDKADFNMQLERLMQRLIEEERQHKSQLMIAYKLSKNQPTLPSTVLFPETTGLLGNVNKITNLVEASSGQGSLTVMPSNSKGKITIRTNLHKNFTLPQAQINRYSTIVNNQAKKVLNNLEREDQEGLELFKAELRGRIRDLRLNKEGKEKHLPIKLIASIKRKIQALPEINIPSFQKLLDDKIIDLKNKYSGPKLADFVNQLKNTSKPASAKVANAPVKSKKVKAKENEELNNSAMRAIFEKKIRDAKSMNELTKIGDNIEYSKKQKTTTPSTRKYLRSLGSNKIAELETAEKNKLAKLKENEQRELQKLKERISRLKLQNGKLPNSNIASIVESPLFSNSESVTKMLEDKIGKLKKKIGLLGIKNTKT